MFSHLAPLATIRASVASRRGGHPARVPAAREAWWPALLAGLLPLLVAAEAAGAPRPPRFVLACQLPDSTPLPLLPSARQGGGAAASDSDDDDDDDDDDADSGGIRPPGLDACVRISGTVNQGLQRDWYRAGVQAKATGQVPKPVTSFPLTASFRIESGSVLGNGDALLTAFEFETTTDTSGSQSTTLTEASATIGPWTFGFTDSRFDFWTGEDFVFVARIPSRTVNLFAFEGALSDPLRLSLSLEDTRQDQPQGSVPSLGRRYPDGVARLVYETDALTVHGALALREVPGANGAGTRLGRAALLGLSWTTEIVGHELRLSGQVAGAVDAAPYIGSQLDRRTSLPLLLPDEGTRGWSAVASVGWDWSELWSSNAYVSRYRLSLTGSGQSATVAIDRFAANLLWQPLDGLKTGIELSVALQRANLAGRTGALALAGRQSSLQAFIERSF